jgi:hypothetical protein
MMGLQDAERRRDPRPVERRQRLQEIGRHAVDPAVGVAQMVAQEQNPQWTSQRDRVSRDNHVAGSASQAGALLL